MGAREALVAASLALVVPCAHAYRPFDGTDAAVPDPGEFELELGPLQHVSEGSVRSWIAPAVVANWGLANGRELVLEGKVRTLHDQPAEGYRTSLVDDALSLKQVHRNGDEISVYTRSLDDITGRVPEIVAVVRALPIDRIVLDGEVLSVGPDGRPLTFQVIASRTMTKLDTDAGQARTPLSLFCFDLLAVGDRDLLDEPLAERIAVMDAVLPAQLLVRRRVVETADEAVEVFADAVADGFEGVVVKKLAAPYAAGRRDSGWVKLKPRHTFDLAVIAAEWGYGRREGWLSNLHLAARDSRTGGMVMLGKTFKGLTDAMLTWQTEQFLASRAAPRPPCMSIPLSWQKSPSTAFRHRPATPAGSRSGLPG